MKKSRFLPIMLLLLCMACQQQKAKQHQAAINDMMEKNPGDPKNNAAPVNAKAAPADLVNNGLMGEWKVVLVTRDQNGNGVLDPAERESGFTTYEEYMKLNPDGTSVFTVSRHNGTYEITEKYGKQQIDLIAADGTRMKKGRIISLTKDELVLIKFTAGGDLIVYNRP